jgi:hypothetical protein
MSIFSRQNSWWYRLAVPWFWLVVAIVSWRHPGDEYGMFVGANGLPSALISIFVLGDGGSLFNVFATMLACSFVTMSLLSWALDRLHVPAGVFLPLYFIGTVLLVRWALSDFDSYARAIGKNGSLTAYVSAASNLSLFATSVLCLVIFAIWRWVQSWKPVPVAA